MKAAPPLELNPVTETKSATQTIAHPRATTGFGTQQHSTAKTKTTSAVAQKGLPELTTFRALTRQVFGAEAGREYVREAVLFVCMQVPLFQRIFFSAHLRLGFQPERPQIG